MRNLLVLLLCAFAMHASATNALLIVNSTPVHNGDSVLNYKLGLVFDTVTIKTASSSATGDASSKQLVFISSTVNSADVTTKFRDVTVPVIVCEQALYDDMKMTGTSGIDHGTQGSVTTIDLLVDTHPLAAGYIATYYTIHGSNQTVNWGLPNSNAVQVATVSSTPAKVLVFGYESAASMVGLTAPARRVGFFLGDNTAVGWTAFAEDLFDAAVAWAAGITLIPPTISITAPEQGATYTTPADITLTATATDMDGSIASVQYYRNGVLFTYASGPSYEHFWNDAPAGDYLITAVATDDDNLKDTSVAVNIKVLEEGVWYTNGNTSAPGDFIGSVNNRKFTIKVDDIDRVTVTTNDTVEVDGMLFVDSISTELVQLDDENSHTYYIRKANTYMGGIQMGYGYEGQGGINLGLMGTAGGDYSFSGGTNAWANDFCSFAYGWAADANGDHSLAFGEQPITGGNHAIAIGPYVEASDEKSMVIGSGIGQDDYLLNDLPSSFAVGFGSDIPTLIVGPSAGVGTTGKVGIGIGAVVPGNKLEIYADANHESGLRFTRLTSSSSSSTANGKCLSVDSDGDVILVSCVEVCCEEEPAERRSSDEDEQSVIDELRGIIEQQGKVIEEQRKEFSNRIAELESRFNNSGSGASNVHQQSVDLNSVQAVVLEQNVPNPFAEQTTISYFVPEDAGKAVMQFTDLSGRVIKSVELQKGNGALTVFAQSLGSGTYTYSLLVDGKVMETKKMMRAR